MSLEEKLDALTAAVTLNTETMKLVLAASAAATGDKPARTTKKKDDAAATGTTTDNGAGTATAGVPDETKQALAAWLGEFAKEEDKANPDGAHREVKARKAALKKAFEGLGVAKLGEITDADKVSRLAAWFEKAKAKGRFDPDPVEETAEDDDGLGV